jgi:hypothetical protein
MLAADAVLSQGFEATDTCLQHVHGPCVRSRTTALCLHGCSDLEHRPPARRVTVANVCKQIVKAEGRLYPVGRLQASASRVPLSNILTGARRLRLGSSSLRRTFRRIFEKLPVGISARQRGLRATAFTDFLSHSTVPIPAVHYIRTTACPLNFLLYPES